MRAKQWSSKRTVRIHQRHSKLAPCSFWPRIYRIYDNFGKPWTWWALQNTEPNTSWLWVRLAIHFTVVSGQRNHLKSWWQVRACLISFRSRTLVAERHCVVLLLLSVLKWLVLNELITTIIMLQVKVYFTEDRGSMFQPSRYKDMGSPYKPPSSWDKYCFNRRVTNRRTTFSEKCTKQSHWRVLGMNFNRFRVILRLIFNVQTLKNWFYV